MCCKLREFQSIRNGKNFNILSLLFGALGGTSIALSICQLCDPSAHNYLNLCYWTLGLACLQLLQAVLSSLVVYQTSSSTNYLRYAAFGVNIGGIAGSVSGIVLDVIAVLVVVAVEMAYEPHLLFYAIAHLVWKVVALIVYLMHLYCIVREILVCCPQNEDLLDDALVIQSGN